MVYIGPVPAARAATGVVFEGGTARAVARDSEKSQSGRYKSIGTCSDGPGGVHHPRLPQAACCALHRPGRHPSQQPHRSTSAEANGAWAGRAVCGQCALCATWREMGMEQVGIIAQPLPPHRGLVGGLAGVLSGTQDRSEDRQPARRQPGRAPRPARVPLLPW